MIGTFWLQRALQQLSYFTTARQTLHTMGSIREIKIPVPWGHIAGRESGPVDGRPLLMLHGWMDNCGTFDGIQQLLPSSYRCVNIDVPGHGRSSHIPDGMVYMMLLGPLYIRLVKEHLGWSRFSLLGHSMGAGHSVLYAAVFPEDVDALIMLDLPKPVTPPSQVHPDWTREGILGYLSIQRRLQTTNKSRYSYDELRKKMLDAIPGLTGEAADSLLVRGAERDASTGKYQFTHDPRYRARSLQPMSAEEFSSYAERLRCRLLLLLADDGGSWSSEQQVLDCCEVYGRNCAEFRMAKVPGQHHVHLTDPDCVLPHINQFLTSEVAEAPQRSSL